MYWINFAILNVQQHVDGEGSMAACSLNITDEKNGFSRGLLRFYVPCITSTFLNPLLMLQVNIQLILTLICSHTAHFIDLNCRLFRVNSLFLTRSDSCRQIIWHLQQIAASTLHMDPCLLRLKMVL